jgi:S-adenosylmethionine hydrolase
VSIVTLTTDFGTRDGYVAQMKGILLSRGPADLRIVDLSHAIPPQSVRDAAYFLRHAVPRFPPDTIHVVVVDPGVGSARRPVVVRSHGQLLVGPDNGVFGWLLKGDEEAFVLDADPLGLPEPSATFHGRDLFAPSAATFATGIPPERLGLAPVEEPLHRLKWPVALVESRRVRGEVVHVDRFGNLISNITEPAVSGLQGEVHVRIGHGESVTLHDTYSAVRVGEPLALYGSEGLLEVAVREGDAAKRLDARVGDDVEVTCRG